MKQALKRLYDVPMLGYALRLVVGIARLPTYLRAYDDALRNIHGWLQEAEPRIQRVLAAQQAATGDRRDLHQKSAELWRIATEAHGQAAFLTQRHDALSQQAARAEADVARLQSGLDRHLPAVLGFISASGAATRDVQRELQSLRREARDVLARLESVEAGAREFESLASALELAQAEIRIPAEEGQAAPGAGVGGTLPAMRKAIDDLRAQVGYLFQRVEFVRRETLFELRYGQVPSAPRALETEPRILDEARVAAASREGLRVNVGCGHLPMEGFVNVDQRELPGVDVIAEAGRMPFDPESVVELYSAHLVEHFPREQLRREILPYWKSLLAPGGTFRAVVPDAATMIDKYKRGEMSWEDLREVTFGGQDYAGDFHYDMFTPDSLKALLEEAGFRDVSFPVTGRVNGRCYEMEVRARA